MRWVRGSSSAWWFSAAKNARRLDHFRRDLDDVGARDRMAQRRAERDAAAEADDRRPSRGLSCSSSGRCATSFCVSMSLRFDASTLPSTASVVVPVSRLTDTVAAAPSR